MRFHFTLLSFGAGSDRGDTERVELPGGMTIEKAPPQLIAALQAAHARDHELVQQLQHAQQALAEGRAALEQTNNLLRQRTIERDHYAQDAHLWTCCLAYIVERDGDSDGELTLPAEPVNAQEGRMLSARVDDDGYYVRITVGERPAASEEGRGG